MVERETAMVARITTRAGITSEGAKAKIWAIYTREKTEVNPVERAVEISMVHKDRIPAIREANSPELYCLKKSMWAITASSAIPSY